MSVRASELSLLELECYTVAPFRSSHMFETIVHSSMIVPVTWLFMLACSCTVLMRTSAKSVC